MSQQSVLDGLTQQQTDAFNTAVNELRLKAQANGTSGEDAISGAMRNDVNGKTARQVIQLGLGWKLARLQEQRSYFDSFLKQNAEIKTKPGDTASADYLAQRRDDQKAQLDAVDRQISDLQDQIKNLGFPVEPAKLPPKPPASTPPAAAGQGK